VDNAPHGVVFVETITGNISANGRAIELVGQPFPGEASKLWERFLTPLGDVLPEENWPARLATEGQAITSQELVVQRPDGTTTPVLVSASRFRDAEGVAGVVVLFEDITVLKDLQQLREDWTTIVTHDLRQPLSVMMTSLGVLERLGATPDPRMLHSAAERMQRAATTLNRMINDLTDVSRIAARQLSVERRLVDFDSLTCDVVERQRSVSSAREIILQLSGSAPKIVGDPVRLEQVLVNLLTNAIKYSDDGTAIDVATAVTGNDVHVKVTNRGPGIMTAELPRLFERYYRSPDARVNATPGLGLGLYIARGLVAAHGGRMWVDSKPGELTTFHFTLPMVTS
jgi:signal transduction histidine kinase